MANEPVVEKIESVVEPKVEPKVEPVVEPKVEPVVEKVVEKQPTKTEILRELSKEVGLNLFEPEGLQKLKSIVDSQKTEQEKLQEKLEAYENEKASWQKAKLEYEAKLKASELGIQPDKLEDALKLAGNDPDKLTEVLKKYPIFGITNKNTGIGIQQNNQNPPGVNTEIEAYMAANPQIYGKRK